MSQYKKLSEIEIKFWQEAIAFALSSLYDNGWETKNNSHNYDVIYEGKEIPPKEVIKLAFYYLNVNQIQTSIHSVKGGDNDTNKLLRDFGLIIMKKKKALKEYLEKIDVWESWRDNYNKFVPSFIDESSKGLDWSNWNTGIFHEFFEKSNQQCVSSLKQGYFTKLEKQNIKNNWVSIAPLLQDIANSKSIPSFKKYAALKKIIRKHTKQDRKAATNRLIASIQPQFLSTVVNHDNLNSLISYLNKYVLNASFSIKSDWFESSNDIYNFFMKEGNFEDYTNMITYPWQLYKYFDGNYHLNDNDMSENSDNNEIVKLLKYKKQIILQGSPGTGKTRLAKEIAQKIIGNDDDIDLSNYLKKGLTIPNASGAEEYYLLEKVTSNSVELSSEKATKKWSASFNKIQEKLSQLRRGESPINKGGDDPYVLAVAKYVFKNSKNSSDALENSDQFKLIQFHSSYTYEDFVRGIVAESNGENIEYKNVNKTLGLFAEKALKNYADSNKDIATMSNEIRVKEAFEKFKEYINDEIEKSLGFFKLTENVGLITTDDEDAFRYKGKNEGWMRNGNRMLFKDILQAYSDNNTVRQDIKKNKLVSGLARQHASYFIRVLNLFQEFIEKESNLIDSDSLNQKVDLKNYVLIIDEINRANLSSVLGELIYALEYRGEEVESMYEVDGSQKLILPPNLYIIGTMNTADRSVGHIDYAIRRRFAFVDVFPKDLSSEEGIEFDTDLFTSVAQLFETNLSPEFEKKDVQLGHSYFIDKSEEGGSMAIRLEYEIKPILLEYVKDGVLVGDEIKQKINDLESSI